MEGREHPQGEGSELRALLEQIEAEHVAAQRALHGFANGSARHEYITARMERIGQISGELIARVGQAQALPLIIAIMDSSSVSG